MNDTFELINTTKAQRNRLRAMCFDLDEIVPFKVYQVTVEIAASLDLTDALDEMEIEYRLVG